MALELRQQLKLAQQLVMTPQLQQAIKLLQLSRLELVESIQQEIVQNPVLEEDLGSPETDYDKDGTPDHEEALYLGEEITPKVKVPEDGSSLGEINWADYANEYEPASFRSASGTEEQRSSLDILSRKPSLDSHLQWQLDFSDLSPEEKEIGQFIIGNLNQNGYLEVTLEEIMGQAGCDRDTAEYMVEVVQEMDPAGIGARDLKESLQLQLERIGKENTLAALIIREHLHWLETNNYGAIAKATRRPLADVVEAVKLITDLNPYPGRIYSDDEPQYIIPDVYVYKVGDEYVIVLNDDGLPRLKISNYYKDILTDQTDAPSDTKEYVKDKMRSAAWLIKSIQQRQRTIYRVVESLLKFQHEFFEKGVDALRPLVLRDVAEDIEMHESTISRVTTNKYVHTPQGTFELKYFFNSSLASEHGDARSSASIKDKIRRLAQGENPQKPLSDMAIAKIFQKEGIKVARRTIAKYREQLGILPSKYRRKHILD